VVRGRWSLAPAAAAGLLVSQALLVRTRTFLGAADAPPASADLGDPDALPVRLLVLGDSTGAGVGATSTATTVGGWLGQALATAGHAVRLRGYAVSGARCRDLEDQVDHALAALAADRADDPAAPTLSVVLIGTNDATHLTGLGTVYRDTAAAVDRLVDEGFAVVLGSCPDLRAARAIPLPLRAVMAVRGRAVAAVQRRAAERVGGTVVDLAAETGVVFRRDRSTLAADDFHPSDRGYAVWADALLPALRRGLR
jgi:lysophospholipase L1-like esterase